YPLPFSEYPHIRSFSGPAECRGTPSPLTWVVEELLKHLAPSRLQLAVHLLGQRRGDGERDPRESWRANIAFSGPLDLSAQAGRGCALGRRRRTKASK